MSAIKQPDFYIGVTRDPPAIVSIGKTIDGMEVIDVVLLNSELTDDKKRVFENAISNIGQAKSSKPNQAQTPAETEPEPVPSDIAEAENPVEGAENPVEVAAETAETEEEGDPLVALLNNKSSSENQFGLPPPPPALEKIVGATDTEVIGNGRGGGKKTKRKRNKRRRTKKRKTKRSKK